MAPTFDSFAFMAALDLALKGFLQPSGYTEPILYAYREKKICVSSNKLVPGA